MSSLFARKKQQTKAEKQPKLGVKFATLLWSSVIQMGEAGHALHRRKTMFPLRDDNPTSRKPVIIYALVALNAVVWGVLQGFGRLPTLPPLHLSIRIDSG
jgi:hypothetical protein